MVPGLRRPEVGLDPVYGLSLPTGFTRPSPAGGQSRAAQRVTSFIATCAGRWPYTREPRVVWRLRVQLAVGSAGGAFPAAVTGLTPGPVLTGLGAGVGRMVVVAVAGLAAVAPSGGPAALSTVVPSLGLAALSAFGPHLASRASAGLQRLDQVGVETETRVTVTSGAGGAAVGTLTETRAAAGDGIGPSRKCLPPKGSGRQAGKNAVYCIIETRAGSERRAAPGEAGSASSP